MEVAVLGAGTMGHGITQVSAMAGHSVTMRDIDESILAEGLNAITSNLEGGVKRDKISREGMQQTLERIETTTDLGVAVEDARLVIEAVPEDLSLKIDVFGDLEDFADADAVLATNTSSLPVTQIASALENPSRALGLHFFNPVHIMDLVEVVLAEQTANETRVFAETFVEDIGKEPILVRDSPGFATSRLGVALGVEAIRMVQEGVADPRDIDLALELGYNHPMGPIELTDVVGLDVRLDVLDHLREELGERFRPPQLLRKKVRAGKVGKKAGEGFYLWDDGEIVEVSGEGESER